LNVTQSRIKFADPSPQPNRNHETLRNSRHHKPFLSSAAAAWRIAMVIKRIIRFGILLPMLVFMGIAVDYILEFSKNLHELSEGKLIIDAIEYSDGVKAAATQKIDAAKSNIQYSLLILAGLWGLFLAKKKDERFLTCDDWDDVPEVVLFWSATAAIIGAWYCGSTYLSAMAEIQIHATTVTHNKIPTFMDSRINDMLTWQTRLMMIGAIMAGWVIFSSHLLKEKTK
jgi:hypothetical protein